VPGLDKEGVFSIHAGPSSSAAITSNGRVFFWGSNKSNKLATFRPVLFIYIYILYLPIVFIYILYIYPSYFARWAHSSMMTHGCRFGQASLSNLFVPQHVSVPADAAQRCVGVSISGEHCVVLTETGRAFASGKMSRFLPECDAEAVSPQFLPVVPVGCAADQVFLHAAAGEDCTVLIGDFLHFFMPPFCGFPVKIPPPEHAALPPAPYTKHHVPAGASGDQSSSRCSIHVSGTKPWKKEVRFSRPAQLLLYNQR
jgi:hypothetical protein